MCYQAPPLPSPNGRGEQIANVGEAGEGVVLPQLRHPGRRCRSGTCIRKSTGVPALRCAAAGMTDETQSPLRPPQRQITHIGVGFAFPAEIANLAMARHKVDIVAIRPKLARDRGDQIVEAAFGKIRATDRAFE